MDISIYKVIHRYIVFPQIFTSKHKSLMAEWLGQASQGHEMYCHGSHGSEPRSG